MKKKKRNIIIIISSVIIVCIILLIFYINILNGHSSFNLDNQNKYIVKTDSRYTTLQNDGGTHSDIYYEIDFDKKIVEKRADYYKGFEGNKYKRKLLNSKELSNEESRNLQNFLESILSDESLQRADEELSYNYYSILTLNKDEVKFYNKSLINQFIEIVE